ncbi:12009_t:CDS:2, partial [Gigaspora margarita]
NLTTLRAEGAHAILKIYFQVSVVTKVSIKKVYKQFLKASNATPQNLLQPCSGAFKLLMKLPETNNFLQQKWEEYRQQFESLQLHQKNIILEKPKNPEVQPMREHPVGAKNHPQSSTERDSSTFELVMGKYRKCGICHGIEYNSRTCPSTE